MSVKLDESQFKELILTIGSEPAFSITSGMFWIGAASFLVALTAVLIALYERRRAISGADAELILKSFEDYENLYDSLVAIAPLANKHKDLLKIFENVESYDKKFFSEIKSFETIDRSEWGKARETKLYFKSRYELIGKGFFSDNAIAVTMDHAGVNLVRNQLYLLDKAIFYQVRLERYEGNGFDENYLERTFKNDLKWYGEIPKFMKAHNSTFGWDMPKAQKLSE